MKKLVYICSPCRGDYARNIAKAQGYCREVIQTFPDILPIAPHVYFTQFLDDTKPHERDAGMAMGLELLDLCDELWVYGSHISAGMSKEIQYAKEYGITIKFAAEIFTKTAKAAEQETVNINPLAVKVAMAAKLVSELAKAHKTYGEGSVEPFTVGGGANDME